MNLTPTPSQARRAARDRRIIADYHDLRKAHPTAAVMQIVRTIAASGKYNLKPENVLYMGDDIPDLECMREVGMPVCPADSAPEVIECSRYISEFEGGRGAVRDIVEQVLRARGDWAKSSEGVTPSSLVASR